jgi:hypothetical protein
MRIELPDFVESCIEATEEFSRQIKKKLSSQLPAEKRLTLDQLKKLQAESEVFVYQTVEMEKLN